MFPERNPVSGSARPGTRTPDRIGRTIVAMIMACFVTMAVMAIDYKCSPRDYKCSKRYYVCSHHDGSHGCDVIGLVR